jgi:shikimate kinase
MKSKKNLILIGMMGSGKSTIGSLISKKLNVKFIDIDSVLQDVTKMKIVEIFEKKGENFFRNLEEKITLKLLNSTNNVISLGGGGFINEKIRKEVLKNNFSFWLNCDTQTLLNRIKKNQRRPIAFNLSDSELTELITKRTKIYSKAQFKINCHKLKKLK